MKLTVTLGQMDIHLGNTAANMDKVRQLTAAAQGADLLLLPELWSSGYDLERAAIHATRVTEGVFAETAVLAQQHRLHIAGSCLSQLAEGGYGNTAVLFDTTGAALATYTKTHLFRLMAEDQYLTAGDKLALAHTAWGKVGLAICYDLRFPELFRAYALAGAQVILLSAEWPQPRLAHWRTLLQARAIENQLYIIACNRVGTGKGDSFCGHSCIIDPWGDIILEMGEEEGAETAVIDLSLVDTIRTKIPVFADRRPDVYRLIPG